VLNGGVDHDASRPQPPRRARRTALLGLAILALASAMFVVRRPLMMSAPSCLAGRWHGCFDTFNGVVLITLVTLPLAALVVWALACHRQAAGVPSARRLSLAEVGMVHGTVPFVWMTLMPGSGAGIVAGRLSLVPLQDLLDLGLLGIVGNLLVFAALGFFAPMRFAALATLPRVLALAAGCASDRDRAVRPAAGPGVLGGRRPAQRRRGRAGRPGVAPMVAHHYNVTTTCGSPVRVDARSLPSTGANFIRLSP